MINIFYEKNLDSVNVRGPLRVVQNLLRSLDDCGIDYSINDEVYEYNLFLHWNSYTINNHYASLKNKKNLLIGPQFWPWGEDIHKIGDYKKVIAPSKVTESIMNTFFPDLKTGSWPVGIYTPEIKETPITKDCLIYYKNRPQEDLLRVLDFVKERNITYTGLQYGNYTQEEFKESLGEVKYCIIIDNTESQGVAIQEMMSVNKPLFVWNQTEGYRQDYLGKTYKITGSTIPYWSDECGEYVDSFDEFGEKFDIFLDNLKNYQPKKFVDRELSPQRSVEILLSLFKDD